jgi:GNAT superfamily N-acetyltransferase
MLPSSLDRYRLVASSLGPRLPALVLRKLAHVDHFFLLTAALSRLRFPRLRSNLRFALAGDADFAEIARTLGALDPLSRQEILSRLLFRDRGFSSCYIGRDEKNELVSMQWLIRPRDNALLERHFRRLYYPLHEDQVMTENIFIYPRFRGLGVFPTVNHHVLEIARREGFRACYAYIRKGNIASLNAFLALGYQLNRLLTAYDVMGLAWRTL